MNGIPLSRALTFGIPLSLAGFLFLLARSAVFQAHPEQLAIGITLDLIITIPLVYFLLIRKNERIPNYTVISVAIIGMFLGGMVLPPGQQTLLSLVKQWILPLLELGILFFLIYKSRKIFTKFKSQKNTENEFYPALSQAIQESFPPLAARLLAMEAGVVYYGLFSWKKRELRANEFSYHQKNGIISMIAVILFMIVVETAAIHLLVQEWSHTAAWILSIISAYTLLQFYALMKSIPRNPIKIDFDNNNLMLKYGFFSKTNIPLQQIKEVEQSRRFPSDSKERGLIKLSPLDILDSHNIIIHLHQEHSLQGLYGIRKNFKSIALHVDDKDNFIEMIARLKQGG